MDELVSDDELRDEAETIYHEIQDAKVDSADGSAGWVGYDVMGEKPVLTGQKGLYSGQLGVALYFAAMYETFGDDRYRRQTYDSVRFLFEESITDLTKNITNMGSLGSVLYGLSVASELTGEEQYWERALQFTEDVSERDVRADDGYSVLLGTAGTLLGLLRLYEQTGERTVLAKAMECGGHLLESREEKWGYGVWDTNWNSEVQSCSTGIGHGAGGIGYSLYRLYAHTQEERYRAAADDAIEFENVFYSEYEKNWKSNWTSPPYYSLWWCFGLSGIGLSRLGSLEYVESEELNRDLDRAKRFEPELSSNDMICHGTFSQVEFLVELGRKCDSDYFREARALATRSITRRTETGSYNVALGDLDGAYNPVLFLGTAGIGYTILRLLNPNKIPSILRFE